MGPYLLIIEDPAADVGGVQGFVSWLRVRFKVHAHFASARHGGLVVRVELRCMRFEVWLALVWIFFKVGAGAAASFDLVLSLADPSPSLLASRTRLGSASHLDDPESTAGGGRAEVGGVFKRERARLRCTNPDGSVWISTKPPLTAWMRRLTCTYVQRWSKV